MLRLGFESAAKMKRLALALLAVIVTLSLVVVVRALRFSSRQITVTPAVEIHLDSAALLGRLSRAIQFRTLSSSNPERAGNGEFERFHDFLNESFPFAGAQLKKEIIGGLSLLYSWPGQDSALKPILLMAHMDVVAAADGNWRHPPFAGAIANGYVWGRGAMDDKSSLMAILEAVEHLLRDGFAPARTIYLAFGHDEEVGGRRGAAQIAEQLRARAVELEFALDEGLNVVDGIIPGIASPVALNRHRRKGLPEPAPDGRDRRRAQFDPAGRDCHRDHQPRVTQTGSDAVSVAPERAHAPDARIPRTRNELAE